MYKGSNKQDPTGNQLITLLKQSIINTGTKKPRKNTPTFPIDKLTSYLAGLGDNFIMPEKSLRMKTIALLALVGLPPKRLGCVGCSSHQGAGVFN